MLRHRSGGADHINHQYLIIAHNARGLRKMDMFGLSDPYLVVGFGGITKKGEIHSKTLDPDFNETFIL